MRPQRGDLGASIQTFGPDFALYPSDVWGRRDWRQVEARYQSVGKTLTAAATIVLPTGFSLYPDRQRAPGPARGCGDQGIEDRLPLLMRRWESK